MLSSIDLEQWEMMTVVDHLFAKGAIRESLMNDKLLTVYDYPALIDNRLGK